MEYNTKLYLLVLYIGFLAPFLLRGLTWAMLYVWTKNYPQVVGTCSGHHGQLISQNCAYVYNHSAGKHDRGPLFFTLFSFRLINWFNLSSNYSNSMENITGKRSDPVRKIINIAQKTRQHCYTKLGKVTQKCHIQVPKKPC